MIVDLAIITAGQVLRVDLRRKSGRLVGPKGTVLTEGMLDALRKRGVSRLDIEPAGAGASTTGPADDTALDRDLDERFSLVIDDPFMQALKQHTRRVLLANTPVVDSSV